jgi:hypothetical protein
MGGHQRPRDGSTNTWLTPPSIILALGPFDLDPCAAPEPRPFITAARHIALPEDGLNATWEGRVWLNPPYGQQTGQWLQRLATHGRGTALIFARTETEAWHQHVWPKAEAILFLRGRLHFFRPDGTRAPVNAGAPSALIAYGQDDAEILRRAWDQKDTILQGQMMM